MEILFQRSISIKKAPEKIKPSGVDDEKDYDIRENLYSLIEKVKKFSIVSWS